jgi:hypothetical protein
MFISIVFLPFTVILKNLKNKKGKLFFLGGSLGLFCGISFLSIFELAFWILKSINSYLTPKNQIN